MQAHSELEATPVEGMPSGGQIIHNGYRNVYSSEKESYTPYSSEKEIQPPHNHYGQLEGSNQELDQRKPNRRKILGVTPLVFWLLLFAAVIIIAGGLGGGLGAGLSSKNRSAQASETTIPTSSESLPQSTSMVSTSVPTQTGQPKTVGASSSPSPNTTSATSTTSSSTPTPSATSGANYAGGVNTDDACAEQYGTGWTSYIDSDNPTAFSWKCEQDGDKAGQPIDMGEYCRTTYGSDAYADSQDGGVYDWGCFIDS
ncbi:hypothetical protein GGR57DRAFT_225306 [Xylariaceae sp. FL1272]|nr:hypothetical protein GGR57DRAFT_225306 [Xylariaceae sp. FL1272]